MEDFYEAGFDDKTIINSINKLLLLSNHEEIFSTVDLAMVDLREASVMFTKIAAPYSYLVRKGSVKRIGEGALPIGILEEINPFIVREQLEIGDVLLLFSDGIADVIEQQKELYEAMIQTVTLKNTQQIADMILGMVLEYTHGAKDDMTVIVSKVVKG